MEKLYNYARGNAYKLLTSDLCPSNFTILANGYHNWLDRRLCEALFVRDHKPFLNKQKNSHKLELFT